MTQPQQQFGTSAQPSPQRVQSPSASRGSSPQQAGAQQPPPQPQQIGGQQFQPPTQVQRQSQQVGGQQFQRQGIRFQDGVTQEMQQALFTITEAIQVCEWCADQCLEEGPGMTTCIRLCEDVADTGSLVLKLGSRDSMLSPQAAELFLSAAEACRDECARHSHAHCQDCAQVLDQAVQSTRQMLSAIGGGTTSQGMGGGGGAMPTGPQSQF